MSTDIEARALAFHETRKGNIARRDARAAAAMTFAGAERDLCMAEARNAIAEEAYQAERQTAEDRWYAEQLAGMSDSDIAYRIGKIDEEVAFLPYRSLTVNIAVRRAGLTDERRRLVLEQFKRSVAAGTEPLMQAAE